MKILHIIRSTDPAGGGPIEGVRQLGLCNRADGHEIEVATLDDPSAPWLPDFPLPLHVLGPVGTKYGFKSGLVSRLRALAARFDVVVVNGIWQYHSFAARRALAGTPVPYYVFPHGMLDPWFKKRYPLKHLKKWLYWPWGEYRVLRDARAVLFTCERERQLARQSFWLYHCREHVVNYGTADPSGNAAGQIKLLYDHFPMLRGSPYLLFLGRLHEKKGCDLLLRAFAASKLAQQGYWLVMAGPDQQEKKAAWQQLAVQCGVADRILWPGMLEDDLKWGAFRAAAAFVLPSHQENFGIAVVEALACGVPVLISQAVNICHEIERDGAGMAEPDDQPGANRLLERWSSLSPADRDRMKQAARPCFLNRFEIKQSSRSMIRALLENGGRDRNGE